MKKKIFSLLLVLVMVLGMFPANAMAADDTGVVSINQNVSRNSYNDLQ